MPSTPALSTENTIDIIAAARTNEAFRRVIRTGDHEQVVVMTIPPGAAIGDEVHHDTDQVFVFVEGAGSVIIDGEAREVRENDLVFVHAGSRHDVRNAGGAALRLVTIYAPPQHAAGTIHETKAEADAAEH